MKHLGWRAMVLAVVCTLLSLHPHHAQSQAIDRIVIGFLSLSLRQLPPASPLDMRADDAGVAGARLAIADNSTSGKFLNLAFELKEETVTDTALIGDAMRRLQEAGAAFIVADLPADGLQAALAAMQPGTLLLNTRAPDDALRGAGCNAAVLHVAPSRAMLADALAQYLVAMGWRDWFLVTGRSEGDHAYAAAIRNAARKFGARIVLEKEWSFEPGSPHADSGHVNLQTEVPGFSKVRDYDVLVVADEADQFGEYLSYRTSRPRPVAGTHGLVATPWSPVQEQWGGLQLQSRFRKLAHRPMLARDYTAWLAVRAVGEAAIRNPRGDTAAWREYMLSDRFRLAGFKGQPLSFRPWDGQMRQPILIAGPRVLVSVSPQAEFLHQGSPLDSLGADQSESQCRLP